MWRGRIGGGSYLHVALAHHDLGRVRVLHQLLQGLRVDVVQRDVGLAALAHLIWGNTPRKPPQRDCHPAGRFGRPRSKRGELGGHRATEERGRREEDYLLVNMAWK